MDAESGSVTDTMQGTVVTQSTRQVCQQVRHRRCIMTANTDTMESAHYHHFHLNVIDPPETIKFYKDFLGAIDVKYRGVSDALFTERSFILLTEVATPAPPSTPACILTHVGWAGVDGPNEYEWLKDSGIRFQTPPTPLGEAHYMYFYGPDDELLEIYTGEKSHRFNHYHQFCTDINAAVQWYVDNLGLEARLPIEPKPQINAIRVDNVNIVFHGKPPLPEGEEFESTEGSVIDHVAFSYRDIGPVCKRMQQSGVEIVQSIAESDEFGHRSFFVMGPEKMLIEIVEDKPIPEGIWA